MAKRGPKQAISIAPITDYTPDQIRKIRLKSGLSQVRLSKATGISPTTIQYAEIGKIAPPKFLLRFLELLEQNPELFEEYGVVEWLKPKKELEEEEGWWNFHGFCQYIISMNQIKK